MLIEGTFHGYRGEAGPVIFFNDWGRVWDWDAIREATAFDVVFPPAWGDAGAGAFCTAYVLASFVSFAHSQVDQVTTEWVAVGVLRPIQADRWRMEARELRDYLLRLSFNPAYLARQERGRHVR